MAALLLCASCASEMPEPDYSDADGYRTLVLTLSLGDETATSRGDFDNFDNELDKWGVAGENIETLRILILDGKKRVEHNTLYNLANDTSAGEYKFSVKDDDLKTIILVCNEERLVLDGGSTIEDYFEAMRTGEAVDIDALRRLTLALQPNSVGGLGRSLRTPLPIAAIYNEYIAPDTREFRGDYTMQRAAVKYSFRIINKSSFDQTLEKIRVDRVSDREFLFPDADYELNSLGHTVIKDYRTPESATESIDTLSLPAPLKLPANMKEAVQVMAPVYLLEGLKGDSAQKVSLRLDGMDLNYWQKLKWRMPGESTAVARPMVDLPRNTHVVVNITITPNNKLEVVADVQPYGEVKVDPWYGLDRDEDGNIIIERFDDGTYRTIRDGEKILCDSDGDRIIKKFEDGSLMVEEIIKRDYIHDDAEVDYVYQFEKDLPGGNMAIIRQKSTGGEYHNAELPDHQHGKDDRPLFVQDKTGEFYYVTYTADGRVLTTTDVKGDEIVQANGFQFRQNQAEMSKYYGTYIVINKNGEEELRYYKDGRTLDWTTGTTGITSRSATDSATAKEISDKLKRAHREAMRGRWKK